MKVRIRNRRIKHSRAYKNPRLKNWSIGTIFLIIIAISGSYVASKILLHKYLHRGTPRAILQAPWQRYRPGQSQLSLELPAEPRPENVEGLESLPPTYKRLARHVYSIKSFKVDIWEAVLGDGAPADIRQAADGAVSALKQSEGVSEYHDTISTITRSGLSGLMIEGSFKRHDESQEIKALLLADGPKLWQVIITHPATDQNGSVAARRILQSVEVKE